MSFHSKEYNYFKIDGDDYAKLIADYDNTNHKEAREKYIQNLLDEVGADHYWVDSCGHGRFLFEINKVLPFKYKITNSNNIYKIVYPYKNSKLGKEIAKKFANFSNIFHSYIDVNMPTFKHYVVQQIGLNNKHDKMHIEGNRFSISENEIYNLHFDKIIVISKLKIDESPNHEMMKPITNGEFIDLIDKHNAQIGDEKEAE